MFKYTKALCRKIPRSIVKEGIRMEPEETPLDYDLAVEQHEQYIAALESLGVQVTVLETDEATPDCVFVEDPAVVIDNTVLITNPGAKSRKPEAAVIKQYFKDNENMQIIEMKSPAELDGGDVMFTGYEIFVGISSRTNQEGVKTLQDAFPAYPVHSIPIKNDTLHLKSMMTMGDQDVILCGRSKDACAALKVLQKSAKHIYSVVRTPDDTGANCVIVNGSILCRAKSDLPKSFKVLNKLSINKIELSATELSKVDGCLSCCSLLYN